MAECHPVGFQWVEEAKARGARVIHVDPRFTRTSAMSDKHIPIRAGSDVVLLGALINHVLTNDLWFKEYVVAYTNAATLINENFRDTEDLGGLFSGYDPETGQYDPSTWAYQQGGAVADGGVLRDETLQHPRTRLPDPQAALRPLHPARWCGMSAASVATISTISPAPSSRTPGASAPPASPTPSAGPSTPSARNSSAPQRSCSCCWATWAARAAASWRCAATPASRAPPTSRRCSTCSPATCRCPRRDPRHPRRLPRSGRVEEAERLLGQRRCVHGQPAQGVVGRRRPRGQRLGLRLPAAADRRRTAPTRP